MNSIGSIARSAGSGFVRFANTEAGRLTIAVSLLGAAIWLAGPKPDAKSASTGEPTTQPPKKLDAERVRQLQGKLEGFREELARAASSPRAESVQFRRQTQLADFQQIFNEVLDVQGKGKTPMLNDQLKQLSNQCAATMDALGKATSSEKLESTKAVTPGQENLLAELKKMDMPSIVANFEDMLKQLGESVNEQTLRSAQQFQQAIQLQLKEMVQHDAFLHHLPLLRRVEECSQRVFTAQKKSGNASNAQPEIIGGLSNASNSCYLHAALQVIATVPELGALFYQSDEQNLDDAQQLRNAVQSMVQAFNSGETVSADAGQALQKLLMKMEIIGDRGWNGCYDSGGVLRLMLEAIGQQLHVPVAKQIVYDRPQAQGPEQNRTEALVHVDVSVVSDSNQTWFGLKKTDVAESILHLLTNNTVKKPCDGRPHRYEQHVDFELRELLTVTIQSTGLPRGLSNFERFDDPTDAAYEYRLIAASENTGGHWVAYRHDSEGTWLRISDEVVSKRAPQNFSYGYYRRFPKGE